MRRREKSLDFENGKGPSLQQSKHNNQLFAITSSPYYQKHNLFIRELHNHLQNNREKNTDVETFIRKETVFFSESFKYLLFWLEWIFYVFLLLAGHMFALQDKQSVKKVNVTWELIWFKFVHFHSTDKKNYDTSVDADDASVQYS